MLLGIGWLDPNSARRWRQGQIDCLEAVMQVSASRISEAMTLFRTWAEAKGLSASETPYIARTPTREALRFSNSGDPAIDRLYRTHWISSALPEKTRERLVERTNRAPELVAIQPLTAGWSCHRCGSSGDLLMMEAQGPACLACTGLDDLEFLPAGDALLTRRAKANSPRQAVVVRFSKSRKRYERQGLLLEPQALTNARRSVESTHAPEATGRRAK